MQLTPNSS